MRDPVQTIEIYDFKEKHVRIPRGWELRVEGRFAKVATKFWDYAARKAGSSRATWMTPG
jgi:hypothetical protein